MSVTNSKASVFLKRIGQVFLGLLCFIAIYALSTVVLFYFPVNNNAPNVGAKEVSIFILSNRVHTDIVVPIKNQQEDWSKILKFENTDSKDSSFQYVAIGWGDKGFYLETPEWKDLKVSTALKAMTHLGSTAMHVDFIRYLQTSEHCKEVRISTDQYLKLVQYIKDTFKFDAEGQPIQITTYNDGYGPDDAFYEAHGAYDLFHTCNSWANGALKACEQKACLWTPVDKGIFFQYK